MNVTTRTVAVNGLEGNRTGVRRKERSAAGTGACRLPGPRALGRAPGGTADCGVIGRPPATLPSPGTADTAHRRQGQPFVIPDCLKGESISEVCVESCRHAVALKIRSPRICVGESGEEH